MFALHFSPLYGFFIAVAVDNFLAILAARHVHRHLAHTLEAALDAFSDPFLGTPSKTSLIPKLGCVQDRGISQSQYSKLSKSKFALELSKNIMINTLY